MTPDNLQTLIIHHFKESVPKIGSFALCQKEAASMKQEDLRDTFKKHLQECGMLWYLMTPWLLFHHILLLHRLQKTDKKDSYDPELADKGDI